MKNLFIASLLILSMSSFDLDKETKYKNALTAHNKKVVSSFYDALERKDYSQLKGTIDFYGTAVYADQGKDLQDTIHGRESISARFQSTLDQFAKVKYVTKANIIEDPAFVTVKVKSHLISPDGAKNQHNYLATFKLKNGKIIEYVEYNNSAQNGRS